MKYPFKNICVSGLLGGCSSCIRIGKSISSDMGGGLNRTVTLYDYSGGEIKSWSGGLLITCGALS